MALWVNRNSPWCQSCLQMKEANQFLFFVFFPLTQHIFGILHLFTGIQTSMGPTNTWMHTHINVHRHKSSEQANIGCWYTSLLLISCQTHWLNTPGVKQVLSPNQYLYQGYHQISLSLCHSSFFKAFQTGHENGNPQTLNHGLNSWECAPHAEKESQGHQQNVHLKLPLDD